MTTMVVSTSLDSPFSSASKPARARSADPSAAIRRLIRANGSLSISDLRAIQRLGSGDIGSVYLAEIKAGGGILVAAKVMDKSELRGRNKSARAKTERQILEMLDHPFLPKLYGCAESDQLTCLITEFCPGGDLHLLRQRQPAKKFNEHATRFYAAELVVAIEYLHVLGVIYRDLKPENVLVRSDGHIMLTDFDLSLKSEYGCSPTAQFVAGSRSATSRHRRAASCSFSTCIVPGCLIKRPGHPQLAGPDFVAEPVDLRSMSFVGTHEYLAPEIVAGEGHGSAVDWWTLGILVYELLYGRTPFKGCDEDRTLTNIVARGLEFPKDTTVSAPARDLVSRLLAKDPAKRLGSSAGAAHVKRHPFFAGINWALLRCAQPPHLPAPFSLDTDTSGELSQPSSPDPVDYY